MDCLFCKIGSGKIASKKVFETDELFVIKDINAQAPVHLLVIPKKHYSTLLECEDPALLGSLLETAKKMAIKAGISESGFRTIINTNAEGGQVVFHIHVHVIGGTPLGGKLG
ncbi:MAG: histidine triad nucleotide-binding protein [Deltaproteobacteria bacterium]|nr:histidine triad nucleotide-binding protein [Deltaproteobacteria bacterium]